MIQETGRNTKVTLGYGSHVSEAAPASRLGRSDGSGPLLQFRQRGFVRQIASRPPDSAYNKCSPRTAVSSSPGQAVLSKQSAATGASRWCPATPAQRTGRIVASL